MKIESYEPFHIGIKLKAYIDINQMKEKLSEILTESGYSYTGKEKGNVMQLTPAISAENFLKKSDVKIQANYVANALNTIGKDPSNVYKLFKEIQSNLPKAGYDFQSISTFIEVIANMIITEVDTWKFFDKTLIIPKIFDMELKTRGIRLLTNEDSDLETRSSISIDPNPNNPKSSIVMKLSTKFFGDKSLQNIDVFMKNFESNMKSLTEALKI